jgi:hypothetical protein
MSEDDAKEPWVGSPLLLARLSYINSTLGCCAWIYFTHDFSVLIFVILLLVGGVGFEFYIRSRTRSRLQLFLTGVPTIGVIVRKRETPRGPVSKLTVEYQFRSQVIWTEQTVGPKTFSRHSLKDSLSIRVDESNPRLWIPSE